MESKLIQIGNSQGLRLPKSLIEKYSLKGGLELIESSEGILIKPSHESLFEKRLREAELNAEQLYAEMKVDSESLSTQEHEEMIKDSEEFNDLDIID